MTRTRQFLRWMGLDPRQFAETNDAWLDPADAEPWEDPRPWLPTVAGWGLAALSALVLTVGVTRAVAVDPVGESLPIGAVVGLEVGAPTVANLGVWKEATR